MASPALNGLLSIERRGFLGRITVAGLVAGTINIAGHGAANEWASLLNGRERSAVSRRDACPLCDRPKIRGPPGRCYTDREARHFSIRSAARSADIHGGTEQDRDQARERR